MLSKAVAVKTIDLDLMCCVGIVNVDTGVMKVFRAKKRNTFGTYVKKIVTWLQIFLAMFKKASLMFSYVASVSDEVMSSSMQ